MRGTQSRPKTAGQVTAACNPVLGPEPHSGATLVLGVSPVRTFPGSAAGPCRKPRPSTTAEQGLFAAGAGGSRHPVSVLSSR